MKHTVVFSIVIILLGFCLHLSAQPDQYKFARLDISQGLSHNQVSCFLRDSTGFMWFGTPSGLNRYDGYSVKVFRHSASDTTSISDNSIINLFDGPEGKIWVSMRYGLNVYDPATEIFYNAVPFLQRYSIPGFAVADIRKDDQGNYWFLTSQSGVYVYAPSRKETFAVQPVPGGETSADSGEISAFANDPHSGMWVVHRNGLLEKYDSKSRQVSYRTELLQRAAGSGKHDYRLFADADGDLWVFMSEEPNGVYYLNLAENTIAHFHKNSAQAKLSSDIVRKVVQDSKGNIWIGTDHGGVTLLNKTSLAVRYLLHHTDDEASISQNSINTLYKDPTGIIWIGTFKKGISYFHESLYKFPLYKNLISDPGSLPYNDINCFVEDGRGNIWIGTNGGGLLYYDRRNGRYTRYVHQPADPSSLSSNIIVSMYLDHQQKLWIGTYFGGLDCFDGKRFVHHRHNPADSTSISDDRIWEIFEDSRKNLWIGTLGNGVDRYDRDKKVFYHYPPGAPNSVHSSYITSFLEDRAGRLWVGTGYGLDVLNPGADAFTLYINNPADSLSLSNNNILFLREDSRGIIWIGTQEGLNYYDPATNAFRVLRKSDGLADNTVLTILEDNAQHLWVSTPNGLSNIRVQAGAGSGTYTFSIRNYDESDGLQGKEFNENAALKTARGELIFAGSNGFNLFDPATIRDHTDTPKLVFTDFQIFNKSVGVRENVNGRMVLNESLARTGEIVLQPNEDVFSVEFAALSFLQPEKIKYRYTLEGFSTQWFAADKNIREATFTNLNPGNYVFRVQASPDGNTWTDKGIGLKITVLPPFWKTRTAFAVYVLGIMGALLLARRVMLTRERLRFRIAQERQEAQRLHELDMLKIRFFTNVSHEFRTPLTLIITPLEKLVNSVPDPDLNNQLTMIQRNARRLLNLVNQLLDFRKMEVQQIKLNPAESDIVSFVKDISYSFSDISEKKNIRFSFQSRINTLQTSFDPDKLEKIIFNLLSNAFKFTPEQGRVDVTLDLVQTRQLQDDNTRWLQIQVRDTGIGIPADKHDKIFERFFQNDIPGTMVNQGSGIGLSITREFVKLHGGLITVESEPGKGSLFTALLPVIHLSGFTAHPETLQEEIQSVPLTGDLEAALLPDGKTRDKKPVLLLVEDNEDFRFYLKDNLKAYYHILEAGNGKEGWQQASAQIPDLIVSDVMMPEMDGIELCRKLKNDRRTSHIPVVLLTARAAEEQKLEGFRAGANDYVTKPFSFEILHSRIKNLIAQQKQLQQAFQKQIAITPHEVEVTSLDEKLIQKAIDVVEKNMANADFTVEELSRELGMSRVHLYKKLLSLTGKPPLEFIRTVRLKRAAQLLEKSQLTVSEIAYQVGFNNPKYFTKYFKTEFNVLPSLYAASRQKSTSDTG